MSGNLPPPPPGFVVQGPPPPPPGFVIDEAAPVGQAPSIGMGRPLVPSEGNSLASDALDAGKAAGSGLVTGTEALIGSPGWAMEGADDFAKWIVDHVMSGIGETNNASALRHKKSREFTESLPVPQRLPTIKEVGKAVTKVTGFSPYAPKTTFGKYVDTISSFIPGALLGPGRSIGNLLKYALVPGAASEFAGEQTAGTPLEPWARTGAAVATGGLAAALARPSTAGLALRANMPAGMTAHDIDLATALIQKGASQGISVTLPEALAQVTKGRVDMTDLQRYVESSRGGRGTMTEFMSKRPDQARRAMDTVSESIVPNAAMRDPVRAGLDVQSASQKTLDAIRKSINDRTAPDYEAARTQIVDEAVFAELNKDPLVKSALKAVREDPVHSRFIEGLPNQSVGVLNEVKKYLDDMAGSYDRAGKNQGASAYGNVAREVRDTAAGASDQYATALDQQASLREALLKPAEAGPLGKMAATEDIQAQGQALMPKAPPEGSAAIVGRETGRLAATDPALAGQLVRTHMTTLFNKAAKAGDQWGPGKAVTEMRGHAQEAKNLEAAVRALPDGDAKWKGVNDFLDVLEATGKRQRPNSATQANMELSKGLERGSPVGVGASLAAAPTSALSYISDAYRTFRLGKNTEALARLITSPEGGDIFKQLSAAKTNTDRIRAAAVLSFYLAKEGHDAATGRR